MNMVYDVFDTETLKRTELGWEQILDATGEYVYGIGRMRENGAKKWYSGENCRKECWQDMIKKGIVENKSGRKYTVFFHNAKYDFYNIADLTDTNVKIICETPFIASYFKDIEMELPYKEFKSWQSWAYKNDVKYNLISTDGKIIKFVKKIEIIKFLDTMNLFRTSLQRLGEIIKVPKMELPKRFVKIGKNEETFIKDYCIRDCEIAVKAIKMLKNKLSQDGINMRHLCTINQVAISYLINKIRNAKGNENMMIKNKNDKTTELVISPKYPELIHEAYRGGYVRIWKTGFINNVNNIDCNSLYPYSAINIKFPLLKTERLLKKPLETYQMGDLLNKIGLSRCLVKNISNKLGLLQVRLPNKSHIFKQDTYAVGTWTHTELKEAIKEGYKIMDIEWSIIYDEGTNPLTSVFKDLYKLRTNADEDFNYTFYKEMMNRGIGKFAQRKNSQEIVIDSIELVNKYLEKKYRILKGIDKSVNLLYSRDVYWKKKKYYCPIIPTLINAFARVHMYRQYKKIPIDRLIYSDTDSVIWQGEKDLHLFDVGSQMGQFKIEKDIETNESLINTKAVVWGSKTKMIGNNISISGMVKSGITTSEFKDGKVRSMKMMGIKKGKEKDIGKFYLDERDLKEQLENFLESERKLSNQKVFIDMNLSNVEYFKEYLDEIAENSHSSYLEV